MREMIFKPSEDSKFSGEVALKPLSYSERSAWKEDALFDDSGELVIGDNVSLKKKMVAMRKLVEKSEPHYLRVALVKKDSGQKLENFEALSYDPDCEGLLIQIAQKLVAEGAPGNG